MDRSLYDLVKSKSDIVKTISSFLDVQKKGNSFVSLCPFHKDTRPSMSINPQMNIFKCFVCGVGGNPIGFVFKYLSLTRSITMAEAVRRTAQINGIVLPKNTLEEFEQSENKALSKENLALKDLASFYRLMLRTKIGEKALKYLRDRQMDDDVLEHFGIGYAPKDNSLAIKTLRDKKGYDVSVLEKAGIISANSTQLVDRYSERIMFPLKDRDGLPVGFSGRRYLPEDKDSPKYVNSPETDLFKKSNLLYNLDNALVTAKKDGYLYVTEGFMDVIALYRAGVNSAVALMGTNLSKEHLNILKNLGVEIRLSLDSDMPGQKATQKWLGPLTQFKIPFKVTRPFQLEEDGKDADEVLDKYGKETLLKKMNDLLDPISYAVDCLDKNDASYLKKLDDTISRLSPNYSFLSPTEKGLLEQKLSILTGLDATQFHNRLTKDNIVPFKEKVVEEAPILFTTKEQKFDGQINLKELAKLKQGKVGKYISGETLFIEAQIISRLPLSHMAFDKYKNSGFIFSSPTFRVLAKYICDEYQKSQEKKLPNLDLAQLDDAKTDLEFMIQSKIDEGVSPVLSLNEAESAFQNLNLLTPEDYKDESFLELLKKHQERIEEDKLSDPNKRNLGQLYDMCKKTKKINVPRRGRRKMN